MTDVSEQSVAGILSRAADLIEPDGRWTQGAFARNAKGDPVKATSDGATCFCVLGAIYRVLGTTERTPTFTIAQQRLEEAGASASGELGKVPNWNDAHYRTQQEAVTALRSAALLAAPRAGEGE